MKLAVNYSKPLEALVNVGTVPIDLYKLPAWPDLIDEVRPKGPFYIHYPLMVGSGNGPIDTERKEPVNWQERIDPIRRDTETPHVNVHLEVFTHDFPDIPPDSLEPEHIDRLVGIALSDVQIAVERYGFENVIIENCPDATHALLASQSPEYIRRVVEGSGCGLLLDIGHAIRAAAVLGMDAKDYLDQLPTDRLEEIHVTGVHVIDEALQKQMLAFGFEEDWVAQKAGKLQDHLPMTDYDWVMLQWSLDRIFAGDWKTPWVVSFEFGGVGFVWEAIAQPDILLAQVPRLYEMVHAKQSVTR